MIKNVDQVVNSPSIFMWERFENRDTRDTIRLKLRFNIFFYFNRFFMQSTGWHFKCQNDRYAKLPPIETIDFTTKKNYSQS